MKNYIYTFVLFTLAILSSCTREGINNVPYDFASPDVICADSAKVEQFIRDIYSLVPDGYNRLSGTSMLASATDEAVNAVKGSGAQLMGEGSWGSTALYDGVVTTNVFANCYTGIRKTYNYFNYIEPNVRDIVMGPVGKKRARGQVLFLRALYNFEIFKRFGGYPIVLNALNVTDDLNIPRSTYDQSVKYISDLCDSAAYYLPTTYPNADFGRATKGAALALKARLWLYAASPLFNDPSKTNDTPEHGAFDAAKWQKAAAAAAAVINLNVYDLYSDYAAFFYTLISGSAINKEMIFSHMALPSYTVEQQNGPVGITNGGGGTCPSWDLVSDYEMKTGIPFDWSVAANQANPFANRDPRMDKSILYNGATWMNGAIQTFEGGNDNKSNSNKSTRTGFYLRKFLNISAKWIAPTGTTNHCWPLLRYGEVLLNYAEAMNEAYGPDVDPQGYGMTARAAIAKIRTRAGLTGNKDLSLATAANYVPTGDQAKMRDAIRHERRIELAFEEHRHLDLRRWKLAETVLNNKWVHGLKIVKNADNSLTYTPVEVEHRVFEPKMYLYPFPETEISRNKALVQNSGW